MRADTDRRAQALIRMARRHPYVDNRYVRAVGEHGPDKGRTVTNGRDHLVTLISEQTDQALP
ncbi:hypothetical protein GCM10010326_75050 [Streptomyces xanthochromogenes]|uniref:Uncharacterized protein n=1 Tax=Streptomyces xanthochromogenes TaxID=67384 RepID=A0ABQ3AZ04_9ACTN|nr:hypothetical protein GCM10010326_75050 [Streptomyces xanthochromogenes]